jgi:hypothetical protein
MTAFALSSCLKGGVKSENEVMNVVSLILVQPIELFLGYPVCLLMFPGKCFPKPSLTAVVPERISEHAGNTKV